MQGKYAPDSGTTECIDCTAGSFCGGPATLTPSRCSVPGFYCPSRSFSETQFPCAAGAYGDQGNLKTAACSGACSPGYFCPEGSTSPTALPCPAGVDGSAAGQGTSTCNGACTPGFYCPAANLGKLPCPPGTTSKQGATSPADCVAAVLSDTGAPLAAPSAPRRRGVENF